MAQLEERVRQLEEGIIKSREYLQRAADEMKLYVSGVQQQQHEATGKRANKSSARDQLQHKIAELEKLNASLRQEHQQAKDSIPQLQQQLVYWEKIERWSPILVGLRFYMLMYYFIGQKRIFRVKMLCQEREKRQEGTVRRERGRETLVLQ